MTDFDTTGRNGLARPIEDLAGPGYFVLLFAGVLLILFGHLTQFLGYRGSWSWRTKHQVFDNGYSRLVCNVIWDKKHISQFCFFNEFISPTSPSATPTILKRFYSSPCVLRKRRQRFEHVFFIHRYIGDRFGVDSY